MKIVNDATVSVLEQFRSRAKDLPWSEHPYAMIVRGRDKLNINAWDDSSKRAAIGAMVLWVTMIVGKALANTLNEIVALMRIAVETGDEAHKKAADDMAASMTFVEKTFGIFMHSVDFEHVAEGLFDDGVKMEEERNKEFAAAEAAKAKVTKRPEDQASSQLKSGTVHKRWEPSPN